MKRNIYLTFIGVGMLAFSSCVDSYEKLPVEQFTIDYVFSRTDSLGKKAVGFLDEIYNMFDYGHNRVNGDYLDAASDDAISIDASDPDVYKMVMGRYTANSRTSDMGWGEYYAGIRKVNFLINNIDVVPFNLTYKDASGKVRPLNHSMKAEARFLRVYAYFELLKRYGGIPLMGDKVYQLGDNMELPRNTFAQCVDYMVKELDDIRGDLRAYPLENTASDAHVATREACDAMKSRILLYAASPLFNEKPIEPGNELVGYASYDKERWNVAAKAAKAFIDAYGPEGSQVFGLTSNFKRIFLEYYSPDSNPEIIFFRQGGNNKVVETQNGPLGFSGESLGYGRTNPTQNLVDAFPMKDGKLAAESSTQPYENRDPRFYCTILHNGSRWLGKTLATYQGGVNNPTGSAQYTRTSYYMRKFMGDFEESETYGNNYHLWVMYRYAEILLNYAEALNEYEEKPSDEVYKVLRALRKRAGIEAGKDNKYGLEDNMSRDEMRLVIQNERRIEMAFEEQRYWDIRRWRLAEKIFEKPLQGMSIVSGAGSLSFERVEILSATVDSRRFLYPIPYSEVIKNRNMVQNPKW